VFLLPVQGEEVRVDPALAFSSRHLVAPLIHMWVSALPDDRLRLVEPLFVEVIKNQRGYVAECEKLDEFGYGDDIIDAVEDLRETVCELFWALQNEGTLSPGLLALAHTLKRLIETDSPSAHIG
jgi:hypothetical protein